MKKNFLTLSLVLATVVLLSGCSLFNKEEATPPDENTTPNTNNEVSTETDSQPTTNECGTDMACADNLVANCIAGSYTINYKGTNNYVSVNGKEGANCSVTINNKLADLGPLGDSGFDKNGDGMLDITCNIPPSVTTGEAVGKYIKENDTSGCTGEMMDLFAAFE